MRPPLSRFGLLAPAGAGLASLGLLAAGCGGGSPGVASVAASTTSAAPPTSTSTRPATPVQNGSGEDGAAGTGPPAAPRGGNMTVINIGNPTAGTRFADCMRKHGVPNLPDPNSQGLIQFGSGIDPHSPSFRSAMSTCRKLLPSGFGQPPTAGQLAQVQQRLLVFSKCMRVHGIEDFPDPSGAALPRIQPVGDLDPSNPRFQTAYQACKGHLPTGVPDKALGGLAPPAMGSSGGG
jgi:hypothetical protein